MEGIGPTLPDLPISSREHTKIVQYKSQGNEAYKNGDFALADTHYTTALRTLHNQFGELAGYAHPLLTSLHLNRAQARLKTGFYEGCIEDSSFVVDQSASIPSMPAADLIKGLTKRAGAREGLEKFSDALVDYRKLQQMNAQGAGAGISRCLKALNPPLPKESAPKQQQEMLFDPFSGAGEADESSSRYLVTPL